MSLSNEDKACLRSVWKEIGPSWPEHCPDAIYRMFLSFPSTKTYFPNFDISPGSPQIQAHGRKVADALNKAVEHIDDMPAALSDLSDKHSQELRVDPVNFKLLKHTMLVTMAANYPEILTPEVLLSLDKLMEAVSRVLISRYR
ncbi:Hemoglobin subunit alpha [Heterocephalus glaber]|uniref:Hemoglobin subunit alpha n=1 Tax=Heterocephalus glaber TaxID=10181 RepID=G5BXY2_HETGA|nr:hemoglobin subunit alpha [Heterocephalus glaber]EHB14143.1 Hemoglobin subunit alpha [Heterocephalus glaber]